MAGSGFQRIEILGVRVDLVTCDGVVEEIRKWVLAGRKAIIANHNLHSIFWGRRNQEMAAFYQMADLVEIDSMPLIFWARLLGHSARRQNRCTYLDWRNSFWRTASERRWKVFCLGGVDGVAAAAAARLARKWPGVVFASHHGHFDHAKGSRESDAIIRNINAFRPDVLLVGMGMPIQETWIAGNFGDLDTGVVLSVGAAFDYEAGTQQPAPRFLGALGLEWIYRLLHQPRRLAGRYLIEPWFLADLFAQDAIGCVVRGPKGRRQQPPSFADSSNETYGPVRLDEAA